MTTTEAHSKTRQALADSGTTLSAVFRAFNTAKTQEDYKVAVELMDRAGESLFQATVAAEWLAGYAPYRRKR